MVPCNRTHCPNSKSKTHCLPHCLHALNARLSRRYETLDSLETKLRTKKADISSVKRRIQQECDQARLQNSAMRRDRKFYDEQMARTPSRLACSCRECAVGSKDLEIGLLQKKVGFAGAYERVLREYWGRNLVRRRVEVPRVPYAAANVVEQEWRRRFVGGPRERVVNLNGRDAADLLRAFEEAFVLPRFGRG